MTDDLIGARLGQYELIELIRRGGMGAVYKAYQPSLDRFVAVKVMYHSQDPQFAVRFKREARAIAQLQHPNILPVYDYNEQGGIFYLVLQYVEGGTTLTDMLSGPAGPMDTGVAINLIRRLLSGLEYAHRRGIIHRDIKPGNVLMPEPDWPMLADFGLAKLVNDTSVQLTMPGLAMGTAAYMAPEQALAQTVDARTDLYAIGVMLYEMLTGRIPFDADQPLALLTKHLYELPPPPSRINPNIAPPVEQIILRTLAKSPDERFQTASEMARALEEVSIQLRQGDQKGRLTGIYQAGVLAFAEGRWAQAVEHLSKLVAIDPDYEDSADLLAAAQEAAARAREDARQQIERVRQRRSGIQQAAANGQTNAPTPAPASGQQPSTPTADASPSTPPRGAPAGSESAGRPPSDPPASAPAVGETTRLASESSVSSETTAASDSRAVGASADQSQTSSKPPRQSAPADPAVQPWARPRETSQLNAGTISPAADEPERHVAVGAGPTTAGARPGATAPPLPATPAAGAPASRGRLPLIIGGAVVLLLLIVGGTFAAGLWGRGGTPTAGPVTTAQVGQGTAAVETAPATQPTGSAAQPTSPAATSAPTIEAIAAPPPTGELILEEPFNAAGELTGFIDRKDDPIFSRGFHAPGVYHIVLSQPNDIGVVLMPRRLYYDFNFQAEIWDESDAHVGEVSYGLAFRAQDNGRFYALLIDARGGRYSVRKYTARDTWTELVLWKESPLVSRDEGHNLLRVDAVGDSFNIYLNDQLIESFSDGEYANGMLGLLSVNGDAESPHMHYDNLAVWSTDVPAPASELPAIRATPFGEMVLIRGGPFILGDNERDDAPPHVIELPDFYIDRTEVTNATYAACVAEGACDVQVLPSSETHPNYATQAEYANYPALHVTWSQAAQFCQWAGKRLPTEAEWEKAASWLSTNEKALWAFGNSFDPALLNSQEGGEGDTTAVDATEPEINNTLHMAGNVSEWTSSIYMPYPYNADDGRETADSEEDRVYRGGSWAQTQGKARSAYRQPAPISYPSREIGFRCAVSP